MDKLSVGIVLLALFGISPCFGQSAQATTAALFRTFMIQTSVERGTAFSIDVDNREYWITAKHLFTGVKSGPAGTFTEKRINASLLVPQSADDRSHDQQWLMDTFSVLDPGKDIDILVLVPSHLLLDFPVGFSVNSGTAGVGFGAECEFLGFPYGGGWKAHLDSGKAVWLPYVKHCAVSAQINEEVHVWVLDGINNEGFSGGPVLFGTGTAQKVFAVISGFHQEALEVLPVQSTDGSPTGFVPRPPELPGSKVNKEQRQVVNANSGFIIAFDIQPAIETINRNPIGPLRPAK